MQAVGDGSCREDLRSPPQRGRSEAVRALVRVTLNHDCLLACGPSNAQKILFWKAALVSSAGFEMPAVLQHLEKEDQRAEAELSC